MGVLKNESLCLPEQVASYDSHNNSIPPSKDENRPKNEPELAHQVGQKVSGQFKTQTGTQAYDVISSVTSPHVKNPLGAFKTIATLMPE